MKQPLSNSRKGFSLLEGMVVLAIIAIVSAMAIISFTNILPNSRANAAMAQLVSQLRSARETAISHRCEVQVQFVGTNQLTITQIWLVGTPPPPVTVSFEGGATYQVYNTVPDTPEAFGNASAVYFEGITGGPPLMKFTTNGSFINAGNAFVNGTVFLGLTGKSTTARAVTILGATGRVRQYHWDGSQWQE
jgi:prepilin-type N-terminal cleavage/methylation domain-containing protein